MAMRKVGEAAEKGEKYGRKRYRRTELLTRRQ